MSYGRRGDYFKLCPVCRTLIKVAYWEVDSKRTCSFLCSRVLKSILAVSKRPEVREKISKALKGKYMGPYSSQWKDNKASYESIHQWIRKNYEIPLECEDCHQIKFLDAANISGDYKRERSDWKFLCRKCHHIFDKKDSNFYRRLSILSRLPALKKSF